MRTGTATNGGKNNYFLEAFMRFLLIINNKSRKKVYSVKEAREAIEQAQKDGAKVIHLRGVYGYWLGNGGAIYREKDGEILLDTLDEIGE
jgi:hypothetical protein